MCIYDLFMIARIYAIFGNKGESIEMGHFNICKKMKCTKCKNEYHNISNIFEGLFGLNFYVFYFPADLYNATHRTVWGITLGWVIYACSTGLGGNSIILCIMFEYLSVI